MKKPAEKDMVYIFLTVFILVQFFILLFSESFLGFGGRENISYYQSARYFVVNTEFSESPLFIAMLAPFAQLGYPFARFFNLIAAAVTMLLLMQIVNRQYNGKFSLLVFILTACSPFWFSMASSCFPEVLLGFILVASVYLFISERYLLASLVVSLSPLVVPAGLFILPVFALTFYLQKAYKSILLLLSGVFIYSLAAFVVHNDFLLLFSILDVGAEEAAGKGIAVPINSAGIALLGITVAGLMIWFYEVVKRKNYPYTNRVYFILIAGSLGIYYSVHYWLLNKTSLDWERTTGVLVPFMALVSLKTFDFIQRQIKVKELSISFFGILIAAHLLLFFLQSNFLGNTAPDVLAMKKAASYLQFNEQGSKLYCSDPLLAHFIGLKPNSELITDSIPQKDYPSEKMEWGDILVWLSGPENDSAEKLPSELVNDSNLTCLISFNATRDSAAVNEGNLQVHLFKKDHIDKMSSEVSDFYQGLLKFEEYLDERVKDTEGIKVWELDSMQEYSPAIRIKTSVVHKKNFYEITAKVNYKLLEQVKTAEVLMVCSVEDNGKSLSYNSAYLVGTTDKWEEQELKVTAPATFPISSNIAVYLWNKDRKHILVEELSVAVKSY